MAVKKFKLADYLDNFGDGIHGTPNYDVTGDYYFINGTNLSDGSIKVTPDTLKISTEEYLRIKRDLNPENTLLVSINGTLGNLALYKGEKVALGKSACFLNLKDGSYRDFIRYVLETKQFKIYMSRVAGQSTIKNVSPTQVSEYEFFAQDYSVQKNIAAVLSALDDKIALNRRINAKLEKMAKRLYDYWFVQFDFPNAEGKPYKTSGGKMVYNATLKREIPEGWEVKNIGSVISKIASGKRPAGGIDKNLKDGIPSLGAECIDELGVFDYKKTPFIPFSFKSSISSGLIENGDILVYKDGAYVGKTTLFQDEFPFKVAYVNEHVFLIHSKRENLKEYLLFSLKNPTYFEIMQRLGKAKAAQPGLNQDDLCGIPIIIPSDEILDKYNASVKDLFHLLFKKSLETARLTALRDKLLPLLMNGQVEVKSA